MIARISHVGYPLWSQCIEAGPSRLPMLPLRRSINCSAISCSGHNRWSKIRHKKGAADAQRSALFSKLVTEVQNALRPPNSIDPSINSKLATALDKAKAAGVPKANIENAFQRAQRTADGSGQNVVYEAVGVGGKVGMMVECMTDNPARCVQRVKEVLHRHGARIAPVGFMFERKGLISIKPPSSMSEGADGGFDDLSEKAVEGGAEDVEEVDDDDEKLWEVTTPPNHLSTITSLLGEYDIESSDLVYIPMNPLTVFSAERSVPEGIEGIDEDKAEVVFKTVDGLEELQDVDRVYTNLSDE